MIETINKIVRTQRKIMSEFEPTPEGLLKLAMPLEKLERFENCKEPVSLETPKEMRKTAVW